MQHTSPLNQITLRHAPVHGAHGKLLAIRLDWQAPADAPAIEVEPWLPSLVGYLCGPGACWMLPVPSAQALASPALDQLPNSVWLEYSAQLLAQPAAVDRLGHLAARGLTLVCQQPLPPKHPLAERTLIGSPVEGAQRLQTGIRSLDQMESAFRHGATATLGWPIHNAITASPGNGESDIRIVLEVLKRIDEGDAVDKLESCLDRSPTLSFRLMGYLNSAACNLRSEVSSLRHAIMMLGYSSLRQWVALLLASSVETPRTRPLMQASIRRAFFLQKIAACQGNTDDHGDLFLCGAFSMLDQMLGKPMAALLEDMPIAMEVKDSLVHDRGPLAPYLRLARLLESEGPFDHEEACEATATTRQEVNHALLEALNLAFATG
ncbi:EAL and HDOD domain-containing protein [Sphaerotilus sp.]|jgi:c-di-GMP phosphodiesterase|uniref:EAL and HDOD domain-containing protein n=1 Tax=Sphaerotilus sp. TaxID=2093942 RepID=UPI0025D06830|nr:HDOD domain-containing protein [Sphaerotilus sp.]